MPTISNTGTIRPSYLSRQLQPDLIHRYRAGSLGTGVPCLFHWLPFKTAVLVQGNQQQWQINGRGRHWAARFRGVPVEVRCSCRHFVLPKVWCWTVSNCWSWWRGRTVKWSCTVTSSSTAFRCATGKRRTSLSCFRYFWLKKCVRVCST